MSSFFQELKRRNVFRVGVAYVVVSWLIIQVVETVSDPLNLPHWTEAFFIVVLLAGLPLILIFSWAFELTPEGLKKTSDVAAEESVTATTGKKLNHAIIAILVMAVGYFVWERQGLVQQVEQTASREPVEVVTTEGTASVAVLPFVNMSADPEQEYFSDGISEELLNLLAKIPELRVPARTSSFQFKGQNLDIGQVAKQLNVQHVLEGSVRKADVRVRVTAQLIEADTGYHLWSETYDRELDDIFAIQDEISAAIVAALSETLGLASTAAPQVAAVTNPEAYNAYLLGQHQLQQRTKLDIEAAVGNLERALELDPGYAPAHAALGLAWYLLTASTGTYGTLQLDEALDKALPHLEKAMELDPELPEALGAYGLTLEARLRGEEALPYYEKALALNPSLTDVRNWYSNALGELGRTEESFLEMQKAYELDPLSVLTLHNYANNLLMRRRFDSLEPVLERLEQIDPVRGATFRGWSEVSRGRAAKGLAAMMRGVDLDNSDVNLRSAVSNQLWDLGFEDAAIEIWPYTENLNWLLSKTTDTQRGLELTLEDYEQNPEAPGIKAGLAWAYWSAGDRAEGLRLAEEFLASLGDEARPMSWANMIVAFDARDRGDEKTMLERIEPLENRIDEAIASGVNTASVRFGKAAISVMRGNKALALEHFEIGAFRDVIQTARLDRFFTLLGVNDEPEFTDLRNRHSDYMASQREELLAIACGPDGFEVWQPSPEDCGRKAAPSVPN
jgi:TolB-like protein